LDAFSTSLVATTVSVAVLHTALGPDHWLPFIALSRARRWPLRRTLAITAACGLAHVASSVLLALAALGLGWEATRVAGVEAARGDLAAWLLVGFGFAYALWGLRRALRRRSDVHAHGGLPHVHRHGGVPHAHDVASPPARGAVWTLFIIFALGPCEPMIPLLVAPAGRGDWGAAGWSAALFSLVTVGTMVTLVWLATLGVARLPLKPLERWSHALAGATVALCGLAIITLGW
jgi:ABC-type nickel/cobalt efflux system permease component RcnA